MTTIEDTSGSDLVAQPQLTAAPGWLGRLEMVLEQLGERLNPILVKEARQAMKSRHFSITFTLLLVCGWGWSLIGVASSMPAIYYAPTGIFMLMGYYCILAVPMLLVVPFSAFRSLAAEREDGTYELLSISTLSARQIVTGKLGSAMLQMLVFYSALAPCIAFTYLLRGVDILSILLLLLYTFCISIILSAAGLVVAGLARSRQWQTLISVVLLLGLAAVAWAWGAIVVMIIDQGVERIPMDDPIFWWVQLAMFAAWGSYLALLILAAAAQNSFPSDNRSTRIRVAMLVQSVLYVGWIAYGWIKEPEWFILLIAISFAAAHWYAYGTLMTAESARLSPRVCRQLPMSFLGRVFLTWFNPGSGTGYVFAVSNLFMLVLCIMAAVAIQAATGQPNVRSWGAVSAPDIVLRYSMLLVVLCSGLPGPGADTDPDDPAARAVRFSAARFGARLAGSAGLCLPVLPRIMATRLQLDRLLATTGNQLDLDTGSRGGQWRFRPRCRVAGVRVGGGYLSVESVVDRARGRSRTFGSPTASPGRRVNSLGDSSAPLRLRGEDSLLSCSPLPSPLRIPALHQLGDNTDGDLFRLVIA